MSPRGHPSRAVEAPGAGVAADAAPRRLRHRLRPGGARCRALVSPAMGRRRCPVPRPEQGAHAAVADADHGWRERGQAAPRERRLRVRPIPRVVAATDDALGASSAGLRRGGPGPITSPCSMPPSRSCPTTSPPGAQERGGREAVRRALTARGDSAGCSGDFSGQCRARSSPPPAAPAPPPTRRATRASSPFPRGRTWASRGASTLADASCTPAAARGPADHPPTRPSRPSLPTVCAVGRGEAGFPCNVRDDVGTLVRGVRRRVPRPRAGRPAKRGWGSVQLLGTGSTACRGQRCSLG